MIPDALRAITSYVILLFAALPLARPGAAQLTPSQTEAVMGRGTNLDNTIEPPFEVDPDWLDRVGEVLGCALERDLFMIVNAHHNDWVKSGYDQPMVRTRLDSIWSQVATRFADAPDRLMFEILNEPFGMTVAPA